MYNPILHGSVQTKSIKVHRRYPFILDPLTASDDTGGGSRNFDLSKKMSGRFQRCDQGRGRQP